MPKPTEEELEARRARKREKRERHERHEREREKEKEKERVEREREREKGEKKRAKAAHRPPPDLPPALPAPATLVEKHKAPAPPVARPQPSSFWQARPQIVIPSLQRSASFSPPPMPGMQSSPPTTPGPSISSRTSATSSKRPYTPDDFDELTDRQGSVDSQPPPPKKERKKRAAARKGWKGWVEGSPPPSEKLINLDAVTVLAERKTRSGKSFDAIGTGRDGWV